MGVVADAGNTQTNFPLITLAQVYVFPLIGVTVPACTHNPPAVAEEVIPAACAPVPEIAEITTKESRLARVFLIMEEMVELQT